MTEPIDTDLIADIPAEQAVLGLALQNPAHLAAARAHLNGGQEFGRPTHGDLWRLLCHAADTGQPTDPHAINTAAMAQPALRRAIVDNPLWISDLWATLAVDPIYYAKRVADQYRSRRWVEIGNRIIQMGHQADPDQIDLLAADQLEQMVQAIERKPGTPSTWAAQDLTAALAGHELDPPPEQLHRTDGHALLYASAVHTLAGEPGTAKTWIALHGAVQAMHGGHHAALIDFEDRASRVVARLLALGARPEWLAGSNTRFHYVRPTDPLAPTEYRDLLDATQNCVIVIIDGVTEAMTMHGYDLNSNQDAATFYALLPRRITDTTGAAVVMIDHVVKDNETRGRWAIGGQHKLAGIDGAAYLVKAVEPFGRGQHGIARITISKDRPGHVQGNALGLTAAEFHLDATQPDATKAWLERPAGMPIGADGQERPTFYMGKVSKYVEAHPECTGREIAEGVKGNAARVRQAIRCLINEGHVEVFPGSHNSQRHRVVVPFDPDERP